MLPVARDRVLSMSVKPPSHLQNWFAHFFQYTFHIIRDIEETVFTEGLTSATGEGVVDDWVLCMMYEV